MPRLARSDLLIDDLTPDECRDWLAPWSAVVTGRVAPAFVSRFGHWFLRRPEGHVEMLDVFTGRLDRAADDFAAFSREVNEAWWQEVYLLPELVYRLHAARKVPGPGQCYALAPHPALGGPNPANGAAVDVRFVQVMDVPVWQAICAQALTSGTP